MHLLNYPWGVRNVGLLFWPDLVHHPHILVQDVRAIKILRQTGNNSASVADEASTRNPSSPLSTWFSLVDLEVGGNGVDDG